MVHDLLDTFTLISVISAILISIGGMAVFFYGVRWKSAYFVAEANSEAWHDTATRLQGELDRLRVEVQTLRARLSELESLPDVAAVLDAILAHDSSQSVAWRTHNDEANARADRIVKAIRELSLGTAGGK